MRVRESFRWDDFTWTWFSRPLRIGVVVIVVAWLAVLGLSDEFRTCESEIVVLDDGARFERVSVCRTPSIADAPVIAPAVLLALLLLPDVKVGFGGFSLERQVRETKREVEKLGTQIATVASSRSTSNAVLNVGTTGLRPGASRKELEQWSARLVQSEMSLAARQIVSAISESTVLEAAMRHVDYEHIGMRVYLHQHDSALRVRHELGRVTPVSGPFDVFGSGTGLVGYVSRHRVLRGVVGTTEVADPSDRYGMTDAQRSELLQRNEDGELPSVIAANPVFHPDSGVVLGVLSCDVRWSGVGDVVTSAAKNEIMRVLRDPLWGGSANIGAIVVRLAPVA